jgi:hypothetical protein
LTFLIAGREATSGLFSFALYLLMRNPYVLAQSYDEVDQLLPEDGPPHYETVMRLDVIPRILSETLRLWAPVPAISKAPLEDTELGGHPVRRGQKVSLLFPLFHTHPKAWERPDEFDIDRWLPEYKAQHHPYAYRPFGTGERACIGRQSPATEPNPRNAAAQAAPTTPPALRPRRTGSTQPLLRHHAYVLRPSRSAHTDHEQLTHTIKHSNHEHLLDHRTSPSPVESRAAPHSPRHRRA